MTIFATCRPLNRHGKAAARLQKKLQASQLASCSPKFPNVEYLSPESVLDITL